MAKFQNDYSILAHENILKALINCAEEENIPYGKDIHSKNAAEKIKEIFECKDSNVFFVSGGTQANLLVISYMLQRYESVICCDTGHINVHETGAVEGCGNKIVTIKNNEGKLSSIDIENVMKVHIDEHMVKPKMVYISLSSEIGSIYSKKELIQLRETCNKYGLYLFIDGARLASALTSKENDLSYKDVSSLSDVFYIGGTKNGTLSGEAIVFSSSIDVSSFRYHIKNKGAMLAKGFVLGIQFEELFKDDLYFKLAKHANEMADYIKDELAKLNIKFAINSPTNQIFIEVNDSLKNNLINKYSCELWESKTETSIVRLVTNFKTTLKDCQELVEDIKNWSL